MDKVHLKIIIYKDNSTTQFNIEDILKYYNIKYKTLYRKDKEFILVDYIKFLKDSKDLIEYMIDYKYNNNIFKKLYRKLMVKLDKSYYKNIDFFEAIRLYELRLEFSMSITNRKNIVSYWRGRQSLDDLTINFYKTTEVEYNGITDYIKNFES